MDPIGTEEFERLVAESLDRVPEDLLEPLDNVVVLVEDEHPEDLLGLYEGVPHTDRLDYAGEMALPDRIILYRLALCDHVETRDELVDEIYVTIVHEVAHHIGIDDDRLHELGWA